MKSILCFGDSITHGVGELPCKGWCYRLKEHHENKLFQMVYNLGVSGNDSKDLLKRIKVESTTRIKHKREGDAFLTIIAIGTNDCRLTFKDDNPDERKIQISKEEFKKNIQKIISIIKKFKTNILFLGLTPVDEKITQPYENTWFENSRVKEFNNIIKEECKNNNLLFLDLFGLMIKENYQEMLADGLHPNSEGYNFMFNEIKQFIEEKELI